MTETDIVQQCQQGDIAAFAALYDVYHQPMLRVARDILHNKQDAEDAVHITFVKLFHSIRHFRFQSKFKCYLFRILSRACYDILKKTKKQRTENIDHISQHIEQHTDLKIQLEEAIKNLPERMRLCFVLFAVEDFKLTEIAEITEMTLGGVKSTLYQARVRLRHYMEI
ncbi:RNA polymerase sigma factor [candidate division KSB1 bacterium]|nr:RNA polymerase sigma factor [candidate division KSB1 bacterium]RQW02601.1 MAG: RNA polymerase sigma factor [candidate division KSB1 bacterium]